MSQKEVYSEEFEDEVSVSGTSADTSQFIQSDVIEGDEEDPEVNINESLDESISDAMGEGANSIPSGEQNNTQMKESKGKSEPTSSSKSTSTIEKVDKFFKNFDDDMGQAHSPDFDELESIMRKIEKLEKSQSVLETTLNFDYGEGVPNFDQFEAKQDLASEPPPAINISEAFSRELQTVENLINMEKRIQQNSDKSSKHSAPSSVASVGVGDRSLEEVLREYDELEQSVNIDLEEVDKPVQGSLPTLQSKSKSKTNSESSQRKSVVQISAETSHSISDHLSNMSKPSVKTQSTNSKQSKPEPSWNPRNPANFTDRFNELVSSELLKQNGANPEVPTVNLLQTQCSSNIEVEIQKYNPNNPRSVYAPKGTKQNTRKKLSAVRNQKSGGSGNCDSSNAINLPLSKMGAGEGIPTVEEIFANSPEIGSGINGLIIEKLKTEISRQEKLLIAYQDDSQRLYSQLKNHEAVWAFEKNEYEEKVNSLKTEIATLKVNRLAQSSSSPLLGTATKNEVDRLQQESCAKTELITDLKREIFLLRNTQENRPVSAKKSKTPELSQDKEDEYQKTIRNLNKQVRTLQRILYSRDPNAALALQDTKATKGDNTAQGSPKRKSSQVPVLESRIMQLEQELAKNDSDAKERLKEFQQKLNQIKSKYEDTIRELEHKLSEADKKSTLTPQTKSASYAAVEELSGKLEKSRSEISLYKSEINRYKRELEITSGNTECSAEFSKYEDRIQELEHKLAEANRKNCTANPQATTDSASAIEELTAKLDKSQTEINHWKSEINRYKRELEIAAKSTANSAAAVSSKQDSATLSLAIKSFKSELAEKEKEIIKSRKELAELKRTNTNLKREREKYLSSTSGAANTTFKGLTRAKTDLALKPGKISKIKGATDATKKPNSAPKGVPETVKILQAALESEREQFELLMKEKKRLIEEQEKQINELRSKMKAKTVEFLSDEKGDTNDVDVCVLEDLRERVLTQNKVISALKEHISSFKAMEMQLGNWKQEKERLEFRITEMTKRCAAAEEMKKPENEILLSLTQKVDDLDSRYQYREKQLDSLLNRLALRTGGSSSLAAVLSPRLTMMSGLLGSHHSMNPISLSPTNSYNLLNGGNLPV